MTPRKLRTTRNVLAAGVLAATLLATGCAGSNSSDNGEPATQSKTSKKAVYDFPINGIEPAKAYTVKLPKDLKKAASKELENLLVDEYHVTAVDVDDPGLCAMEIKPKYRDGAIDELTKLDQHYFDTWTEEELASVTESGVLASNLLNIWIGDAGPLEDFDPATVDGDVPAYVSADFQTIVRPVDCALSPYDFDHYGRIIFPIVSEKGNVLNLASIKITVMKDGTLGVTGEIEDYVRDSNGTWIRD